MDKVLIVEDSKSFSSFLSSMLSELYGYVCTVMPTLAATEEHLKQHASDYFCAIVDVTLPDAPNGEAIDLVLEHNVAVVVFTSRLDDAMREDFLDKQVADYVLKQGEFNIDYLTQIVHRLNNNRRTKVMVVDDSRIARTLTRRLLETQLFQVVEAENAEAALERLQQHPDTRIAIVDNIMDGMDGIALTKTIREQYSKDELAVIGISSQGGQAISAKFIKSGANDFLNKPFLTEEFTCRVNQNAELLDTLQELKSLSDEKSRLLGMAAHDIRGPLGVIQGISQRLIDGRRPESTERMLEMVHRTSNDMLMLLNNLLDLSAIESGKVDILKQPNDLKMLAQSRINLYQVIGEKKDMQLETVLNELPEIEFDQERIKQVMDNLLSNAIKYSPLGSTIQVSLESTEQWARFSVLDQGPGIKPEDQDKLFGTFAKLSSKATGGEKSSGLGLAICKNLIEAHDGRLGYEDGDSGGGLFYFELPIH